MTFLSLEFSATDALELEGKGHCTKHSMEVAYAEDAMRVIDDMGPTNSSGASVSSLQSDDGGPEQVERLFSPGL